MRKNIAEFQRRLKTSMLSHGTHVKNVTEILNNGLVGSYVYSCTGDNGWMMHEDQSVLVRFPAHCVADRTYIDPEGQWGITKATCLDELVKAIGLEAALDELEACLSGNGFLEAFDDDPLNPDSYNLVTIGSIDAKHLTINF